MCPQIAAEDVQAILHLVDRSGDGLIEFEELLHFLESGQPQFGGNGHSLSLALFLALSLSANAPTECTQCRAEWIKRKLVRSTIPRPIEYLSAFKGLPAHFRKSELAELAKQHWLRMSDGIGPRIDADGVSLHSVGMDPVSLDIERQFECESLRTVAADGDVDGGAIGIGPGGGDRLRLRRRGRGQLRLFRLTECSGVPLPAAPMADRVVERRWWSIPIPFRFHSDSIPRPFPLTLH